MAVVSRFIEPKSTSCAEAWRAYLDAAKEALEASEAATPFLTLSPLKLGEAGRDQPGHGRLALNRAARAKQAQADAYQAWVNCRKAHGIGN